MDENKEEIKALDENQTDNVAGGTMKSEKTLRKFIEDSLKHPEKIPHVIAYGVPKKLPLILPRSEPQKTEEPDKSE